MTRTLSWVGERARGLLAIGMLLALAVPSIPDSVLRVVLPVTSSLILAVAFARLDARAVVDQWKEPRIRRVLLWCLAGTVPLSMVIATGIARALGLDPTLTLCLALFAAAPPIASGAALCYLLGFDAVLALQLTVASTLLTPVVGPLCLVWIAGIDLPVTSAALFASLSAIVTGGLLVGRTARHFIGRPWIDAHPRALDGVATIAMLCFIVPMFADVTNLLFESPLLSLALLATVFALNIGVNLLLRAFVKPALGAARAGALGLMSGNRNLALYYASVPPEPVLGLFVALYQVPMFLTPLLLARFRVDPATRPGA
ncbi:MAG: hypothetical protein AAGA11_22275 [Pseudomonadota bacterium]